MAQQQHIVVKAGDTEPLKIVVGATGLVNLDDVQSAVLYLREVSVATNHVDGVALTVSDSAARELTFDPVGAKSGGGNALDAPGTYLGYVLITWDDADKTRHPGNGMLRVTVHRNYE